MSGWMRSRRSCRSAFPATEIIIHLDPEGHTDRETHAAVRI